jgi:hypothetical protein
MFIGIWGVVVVMALLVIFWHSYLKAWVEQRKRRRWQREQREGFRPVHGPRRTYHRHRREFDGERWPEVE